MEISGKIFNQAVNVAISNKTLRNFTANQIDNYLHKAFLRSGDNALPGMLEKRYQYASSLLHGVKNNLDKGYISPEVIKKTLKVFIGDNFKIDATRKINAARTRYFRKYGQYPPSLCVLSPTQSCNLHCTGCYAVSDEKSLHQLSYETVRNIARDMREIMGSGFITISGGEPFIYKDGGKTLLDLFEEFNDLFFLIYTNGTLINEEVAARLAQLGNVTPAISVEGYEKETDERRGSGTYKRVLEAMENLRKAGVPFGISVTATQKNVGILLDDHFYDYFFREQGAVYMWQFQMMPVGRGKEVTELMVTPEQRVALYKMWEQLMKRKYCVADFWNSGALTEGCLAYGRWGGYFYINWDGKIMPCVFVPFSQDNINDLYAQGKTLADGLHSKLMKNGRKWQHEYGFKNSDHRENILMPCSIRDHFDNFRRNILPDEAIAENPEAEVIRTEEYRKLLTKFDQELSGLTREIWEKTYL